jgi:mannose/fructose-specific phosphotransferase system component IIA
MANALDQYLAQQLTSRSLMKVVTDPQKATLVFTDRLGASLEQTMADLYGTKPKGGETAEDDPSKPFTRSASQGQRGRGTIFLVDRNSGTVVWSDFEDPQYPSPDAMKQTAAHISGKLAHWVKGK